MKLFKNILFLLTFFFSYSFQASCFCCPSTDMIIGESFSQSVEELDTENALVIDKRFRRWITGNGKVAPVYKTSYNGRELKYGDPSFSFQGQGFDRIIVREDEEEFVLKGLDPELTKKLSQQLMQGVSAVCPFSFEKESLKSKTAFIDCHCYAAYLKGYRSSLIFCEESDISFSSVSQRLFFVSDENEIKPGDWVHLVNKNSGEQHASLFLAKGLYVSKLGSRGIHFNSMESFKKIYSNHKTDVFDLYKVTSEDKVELEPYIIEVKEISKLSFLYSCVLTEKDPKRVWQQMRDRHRHSSECNIFMEKSIDEFLQAKKNNLLLNKISDFCFS